MVRSLVAGLLIAVSMILFGLIYFDLPGMFASGVLDQAAANDFNNAWGSDGWKEAARQTGALVIFGLNMVALTLLLYSRRRAGFAHLSRSVQEPPMN